MRRINRYLVRQIAMATLFVTGALAAAIWLAQSLRLVELVVEGGAPIWVFFWLMILTLPTFLGVVLPIGLVGAVLFTYNRMTTESELVVMRAAGLGPWALAAPAIQLAGIGTLLVFALNLWITPAAHRELVKMEYLVRSEYSHVFLREGVFNDVTDRITVYVRERTSDGELRGLMIHDTRAKGAPVTIMAERGTLVAGPVGPRVVLYDGTRQEAQDTPGHISHLYFDRYVVDLNVLKPEIASRWSEPRERGTLDLLTPGSDPIDQANRPRFFAEFHMRLSTPFFAMSFTMIGLVALLSGQYSRRGQARRIAVAALLVIVLQGIGLGLANAAAKNAVLTPLLYGTVLAPTVVGMVLLGARPGRRRAAAAPAL